jgi:UDP-glucose 4-epimerase
VQIPLINENKSLGYEVNVIGTQNVCKAVEENPNVKGMIIAGSWHTVGERELKGMIDEEFGFRPDKVEDRARLYALSKIAQESIVRFYDEMSNKIYGIIRMGTILGEGMPEKTAANIFIERGLKGETITPYKHSMHRPMLYANIGDICRAFEAYAKKILDHEIEKSSNSLAHIVNVYYPEPITILEIAEIVKESVIECTSRKVMPKIEIVDNGIPSLFTEEDKNRIKVDINKAKKLLGLEKLKSPRESIREIVKLRVKASG